MTEDVPCQLRSVYLFSLYLFLYVFLALFRVRERKKKDEQKQKGEHTRQCKLDNAPFSFHCLSLSLSFSFLRFTYILKEYIQHWMLMKDFRKFFIDSFVDIY